MELTKEQRIMYKIIIEAWDNPDFKEELKAKPVEAIKNLTGETIDLPEGVQRVEVVDRTDPTCLHIIIPKPYELEDAELTDEQLEMVAGGEGEELAYLLSGADIDPGFTL